MKFLNSLLHFFYLYDWLRFSWIRGPRGSQEIGISFDDGPNMNYTPLVLRTLQSHGVQATFFWIPEHAEALARDFPLTFRRIVAMIKFGGHEIGLHGRDIRSPWRIRLTGSMSKQQLADGVALLERLTGEPVTMFRPHYVQFGPSIRYARELGLTVVWGSVVPHPATSARKQMRKFKRAKAGDIVVFHDGTTLLRSTTVILDVLPWVLQYYKNNKKLLATLAELLSSE